VILIGWTLLTTNGHPLVAPRLNRRRALFVLSGTPYSLTTSGKLTAFTLMSFDGLQKTRFFRPTLAEWFPKQRETG